MARAGDIVHAEGIGEPEIVRCPICRTTMRRALVRFEQAGQLFGYFPADVCEEGHDWLTEEAGEAIEAISKAKGLFGRDKRAPKPGEKIF